MRNVLVAIIVVIVLGGASYFFLQSNNTQQNNTATPTPTQTAQLSPQQSPTPSDEFCDPSQLNAMMNTEVAAGNAYVTLTIENTSEESCQVVGNNLPEVGYPQSVENFETNTVRQPTTNVFTLEPNQTIYSLIHFPNGPQCSSVATQVDAMVSYEISDQNSVSFKPTMGTTLSIPSCGDESEITTIDLYPFSSEEVTP